MLAMRTRLVTASSALCSTLNQALLEKGLARRSICNATTPVRSRSKSGRTPRIAGKAKPLRLRGQRAI
jgi:hypothetical protein